MDLARAVAVFGMFAVHVGPIEAAQGDVGGWVRSLAEGRASALFAMLAGFSLMLIAGRFEPKVSVAGLRALLSEPIQNGINAYDPARAAVRRRTAGFGAHRVPPGDHLDTVESAPITGTRTALCFGSDLGPGQVTAKGSPT